MTDPVDELAWPCDLFVGLGLVGAVIVLDEVRPRHRVDCREARRPCPMVACKSNMIMDVVDGHIILNSGLLEADRGEGANRIIDARTTAEEFHAIVDATLEWWARQASRARRLGTNPPESCLEDVIQKHVDRIPTEEPITGMDLEDVGAAMFITRERARQIESAALKLLRVASPRILAALISGKSRRPLARIRKRPDR